MSVSVSIFPPTNEWDGISLTELEAASAISVYTDRRVERHELPAGEFDRRGWWGDTFEPEPLGSRVWLTERGKIRTEADTTALPAGVFTPERVKALLIEAHQWLIDDGVCTGVEVVTERAPQGNGIFAEITLVRERTDDDPVTVIRYDPLWETFRNG
jgi:phage gp46-like protein